MGFTTIPARDLDQYVAMPQTILVDLREPQEYEKGHIPGAINLPYVCFEESRLCLIRQKTIILYCERGSISLRIARKLSDEGYRVLNLYGGIHAYRGKKSIDC